MAHLEHLEHLESFIFSKTNMMEFNEFRKEEKYSLGGMKNSYNPEVQRVFKIQVSPALSVVWKLLQLMKIALPWINQFP